MQSLGDWQARMQQKLRLFAGFASQVGIPDYVLISRFG